MKPPVAAHETLSIEIDEAHAGLRLDHALSRLAGLSRNHIQQLLRDGHIRADTPDLKPARRVAADEVFYISIPRPRPLHLEPEAYELDILYEDNHLLVVNKPAGMAVHPGAGHSRGTLVHALLHHCPDLPGINGVERPGIVHRLDKDTSGALVVAKTEAAHHGLTALFARHDIQREYLAWCRGAPAWGRKRIDLAIGRHPRQRQKMSVRPSGKTAITDVVVEHRYGHLCRVRLTLQTGRTHQIRVHLSHLGMPILGDRTYARAYHPSARVPEPARGAIIALQRQALHAEVLGFIHPVSGEQVACRAPLPADLQRLSEALDESFG